MRLTRTAVLILAAMMPFVVLPAAASAQVNGRKPARIFTLVNAGSDSLTALAFAPAGRDDFQEVVLDEPLQGGLTSTTIRLPAGDCIRDVRATFKNGRTELFPGIDVCRHHGLRLAAGKPLRRKN
jgi:hypothetical protein